MRQFANNGPTKHKQQNTDLHACGLAFLVPGMTRIAYAGPAGCDHQSNAAHGRYMIEVRDAFLNTLGRSSTNSMRTTNLVTTEVNYLACPMKEGIRGSND